MAALPLFPQDQQGKVTLWNPLKIDNFVFLEPQVVGNTIGLFITAPTSLTVQQGGPVTAIVESQAAQADSIVIKETYFVVLTESQAHQTDSITVSENYTVALAESQAHQTESITDVETYRATIVEGQAHQAESISVTVGTIGITLIIVEGQAGQTDSLMLGPAPVHERGASMYNMLNRRVMG